MRYIFTSIGLVLLMAVSCDRTRSSTGWDYMPDMYYSEAYETWAPNENFPDGINMRTPVEGTIPRDMVPFAFEKSEEELARAGRELRNPLPAEVVQIERGGELYGVFCKMCHGEQGDGQGFLFTSGRYPYPPANLTGDAVVARADGELYHAITVGYGVMGAHGAMIGQDERWQIVHYIRAELQK
jgi:mono/diheme cytochrome c family protein